MNFILQNSVHDIIEIIISLKETIIINIWAMLCDPSSNVTKIYSLKILHIYVINHEKHFNIRRKNNCVGSLPATDMFYLYDTLVRPVLTYRSDVWGFNKSCVDTLDNIFWTMWDAHYMWKPQLAMISYLVKAGYSHPVSIAISMYCVITIAYVLCKTIGW